MIEVLQDLELRNPKISQKWLIAITVERTEMKQCIDKFKEELI